MTEEDKAATIRRLIQKTNKKVSELAQLLDIPASSLYSWQSGKRSPSAGTYASLKARLLELANSVEGYYYKPSADLFCIVFRADDVTYTEAEKKEFAKKGVKESDYPLERCMYFRTYDEARRWIDVLLSPSMQNRFIEGALYKIELSRTISAWDIVNETPRALQDLIKHIEIVISIRPGGVCHPISDDIKKSERLRNVPIYVYQDSKKINIFDLKET